MEEKHDSLVHYFLVAQKVTVGASMADPPAGRTAGLAAQNDNRTAVPDTHDHAAIVVLVRKVCRVQAIQRNIVVATSFCFHGMYLLSIFLSIS